MSFYEYRSVASSPPPPSTLFGKRLREARLRAGLPQDKLGVAIGIDEGAASARISRYEAGVHEPSASIANRLAKVLGVLPPYLYCEDDDLAAVILTWGRLPATERLRASKFILGLSTPD